MLIKINIDDDKENANWMIADEIDNSEENQNIIQIIDHEYVEELENK